MFSAAFLGGVSQVGPCEVAWANTRISPVGDSLISTQVSLMLSPSQFIEVVDPHYIYSFNYTLYIKIVNQLSGSKKPDFSTIFR